MSTPRRVFPIDSLPDGLKIGAEWQQEPIAFVESKPAPIHPNVLPGILGKFAQAVARHTDTPNDLAILTVLGATSAAVAGKMEVEPEAGYSEPVLLWVATVLESGNRKSAVMEAATAPIIEYEQLERDTNHPDFERRQSELKTKRAAIEKLRKKMQVDSEGAIDSEAKRIAQLEAELPDEPHKITLVVGDTTAERLEELMEINEGRMAIISDEAGMLDVMAGRYSAQPNLAIFLKGHNGGRVSTHRKTRATTIPRAYLTMCLAPQPGVIEGLKDKPFMRDRGLLARFLYATPESLIGKRANKPSPIPVEVQTAYHATIQRLLRWRPHIPQSWH